MVCQLLPGSRIVGGIVRRRASPALSLKVKLVSMYALFPPIQPVGHMEERAGAMKRLPHIVHGRHELLVGSTISFQYFL